MPPNFFFFQRSLTSSADGKPSELVLSVGAIFLNRKVVQCTMYKNSWKGLTEENLNKNCSKTIRLPTLDFYELLVDSAFGFVNYQLTKISSS